MHPVLFEAGPLTFYTYGLLLAAAYLLVRLFILGRRPGSAPVLARPRAA